MNSHCEIFSVAFWIYFAFLEIRFPFQDSIS
uniref:Uncharacterized protein n=1 Tax=Siphoviridae sp. ctqPo10 TaxID=2827948 RepID=A0A8S5SV31_9CAUD|nr:MAG TPA: hypothetical protein [Siphoviridae sp. ctqPo10]